MRLLFTLILIVFPLPSIKASEFKQTEENFSLCLNRIIEISRNQELEIENRIVLLNTELKQLDLNVEKLDRVFLIEHKQLSFKMIDTRNYLETYLGNDFLVNNCHSYRLSVIHGFSPRNEFPEITQIPEGAYFSLRVLSNLCSDQSMLDFTPEER